MTLSKERNKESLAIAKAFKSSIDYLGFSFFSLPIL